MELRSTDDLRLRQLREARWLGYERVPLGMSRIHPEYPESDRFDRSVAADALPREEPDEEEDEEEHEDDGKEDDDDEEDDGLLGLGVKHASVSHRETAVEENQSGHASATLDRREYRQPSRAYSRYQQPWCEAGGLLRRDEGWRQDRNSIPP